MKTPSGRLNPDGGDDIAALRIKKLLGESGVTLERYAKLLGVSKKTLYNKLMGATEFTISEYRALKEIFPEYDVLYLLTDEADDHQPHKNAPPQRLWR